MRLWLSAAVLLMSLTRAHAAPLPDGLDGTDWKMRNASFLAKVFFWKYDHLSFKDGKFRSVSFEKTGFVSVPYLASKGADGATWTATLQSAKNGKIVWEGRRNGDRMEGTWIWVRLDGTKKSMSWAAKQVFHGAPPPSVPPPSDEPSEPR